MKKKNSIVSLILALCLCLAMAVPAFAADDVTNVPLENTTVEVNGYSFDIQEKVDEDFTIVRTYVNPDAQLMMVNDDVGKAKALLIALGMDEESLALWTDETILTVANSEKVTISDSYYEINDNKNTVTQIPADVAIREAEILADEQMDSFIRESINAQENGIEPLKGAPYETSFIRVYHLVSYMGNAKYLFSTDSLWLTMPAFRDYDSLGSCAQLTTATPNTNIGSWSYDMTTVIDGQTENKRVNSTKFVDSGLENNGGWAGAAGVFRLPASTYSNEGNSIKCDNFRAHYEYQGKMNSAGVSNQNFNSKGTYSHTTVRIGFTPSFSIEGGNIGVDVTPAPKYYTAWVEENYPG